MIRSLAIGLFATALLMSGLAMATVRGEQSASQESSALLNEVRLLRHAIEMLAGTGARVQIVFGRLQLQEQRTTAAVRRLDDLRSAVVNATNRAADMADRIKDVEALINDGRRAPEEQPAIQQELQHAKREWTRLEAERARLAAEEADAAALVAQEQGRWSDLNRQLEDFERALTPRPQ
jgi:chromosome segregation ATPase